MKLGSEVTANLTLEFAQKARERKKNGERIISLGIGEPDFDVPQDIITATVEALKNGFYKYSDPQGILSLRTAIADKLKSKNNINVEPDQIIVTPGAKGAIFIALMTILEAGDEVINFTPSYVSYVPQIKIAEYNSKVINFPLNKDDLSIDFEKLEKAITENTKAILFNTPHNPTGKMFSREEVERLRDIVLKNKLYIISDEIYELLNFSGNLHYSLGAFEEIKDQVITINGFSKPFCMTGWRIGYLVLPKKLLEKATKLQHHINTNTTTFVQKGAEVAVKSNAEHLKEYNIKIKNRLQVFKEFLEINKGYVKCTLPDATFYCWLDISALNMTSNQFARKLVETKGVATTPGLAFGESWDNFIRIALTCEEEEIREGLDLITEFIHEEAN